MLLPRRRDVSVQRRPSSGIECRPNGWYATASSIRRAAYQGTLGNVDQRLIRGLERVTVGSAFPISPSCIDVPCERRVVRARLAGEGGPADRYEAKSD